MQVALKKQVAFKYHDYSFGRPRKIHSGAQLFTKFQEYVKQFEDSKYPPVVSGFCVYLGISRDTYYEMKKYFPDIFAVIDTAFEHFTLYNDRFGERLKIFYLTNKFNTEYKNKIEQESTVNIKFTMEQLITQELGMSTVPTIEGEYTIINE